jgi:hypothetical protein
MKKETKETKKTKIAALEYKFVATSKKDAAICTISLINEKDQRFVKTVAELKEMGIYERLINKEPLTAKQIKKAVEKHQNKKSGSKLTKKKYEVLAKDGYLVQKGNSMYHPNLLHISMPQLLVQAYAQAVDNPERKTALNRFWYWCCLNPNQEAARGLFQYMEKNGLHITNNGFILTYRNVNIKSEGEKALSAFITNSRATVKKQKQSAKNYLVIKVKKGDYRLYNTKNKTDIKEFMSDVSYYEIIGENLEDAYDNVELYTGTIFTDAHTGTFSIIPGKEVRMNRADTDQSKATCSTGLHSCPYSALGSHYAIGTQKIAILINPMDVVSVPGDYGGAKMRSCAYYPIGAIDKPLSDNEQEVINFDSDFMDFSYDQLKSMMSDALKNKEYNTLEVIPEDDIKALLPSVQKYQNTKRSKVV